MDADLLNAILGVGIVTRDRWESLRGTLQALEDFGMSSLQTLVLDDASLTLCPTQLMQDFPWVRFARDETNRGLVVQRNRIAEKLTTKLWLEIDDDSYPIAGSLIEAVRYMEAHPKTVCMALNVIEKSEVPVLNPETEPWPVQRFVGCAGLINRELFLKLGGYREEIFYYGEEGDFCARAFDAGYSTVHYSGLVIRHCPSQINRSTRRIAYYQGRNRWLLAWWNFPMPFLVKKLVMSLPGTLSLVQLKDFPSAILGFFNGIFFGIKTWRLRSPMRSEAYRLWNSLHWKGAD